MPVRKNFPRKKRPGARRRPRKYGKYPFSKKQVNIIKHQALKVVNKTRELKNMHFTVDERTVSLGSQGIIRNNLGNSYVYNYIPQNDGQGGRIGNQINPISFRLSGWHKINTEFSNASYREVQLRVVLAYVDNDTLQTLESSLTAAPIMWSNQAIPMAGDYKDILRSFNWKMINPIMDKTFTVAPNPTFPSGDSGGLVNTYPAQKFKDYGIIKYNHRFNPKKELQWDNVNNDCWQKNNLVLFAISRLMNDDLDVQAAQHEFCLEGNFYFHDA